MNIAIFCVNYNTYTCLGDYLLSIATAQTFLPSDVHVSVYVADNTVADPKPIAAPCSSLMIRVFSFHENLGYLGAVQRMMGEVDLSDVDYVLITNVDILLEKKTLAALAGLPLRDDVGWIAPSILSSLEGRDRNPSILVRPSRLRLRALLFMYSHPWLHRVQRATIYRRKRFLPPSPAGRRIYAGHGSVIILTREFMRRIGNPAYPLFLYGEELYLAEMCRKAGLGVAYEPSVCFLDKEHASTGSLPSAAYYRYGRENINYILRTFYGRE